MEKSSEVVESVGSLGGVVWDGESDVSEICMANMRSFVCVKKNFRNVFVRSVRVENWIGSDLL